jgi:hypothetical protein
VCCQVEVSALGWSFVQRSPTECGVFECDSEASIMRRPWPTRGCCAIGKKKMVGEISCYKHIGDLNFLGCIGQSKLLLNLCLKNKFFTKSQQNKCNSTGGYVTLQICAAGKQPWWVLCGISFGLAWCRAFSFNTLFCVIRSFLKMFYLPLATFCLFLRTRAFSQESVDAFFAFINTIFRQLRIRAEFLVKSFHQAVRMQ